MTGLLLVCAWLLTGIDERGYKTGDGILGGYDIDAQPQVASRGSSDGAYGSHQGLLGQRPGTRRPNLRDKIVHCAAGSESENIHSGIQSCHGLSGKLSNDRAVSGDFNHLSASSLETCP